MKKCLLISIFILVALFAVSSTASAQQCVLPPNNVVNWLAFDGTPDSSVGLATGTLNGGAVYSTGKVGQALEGFGDASASYWASDDVASSYGLDIVNNWTLETWFNFKGGSGPSQSDSQPYLWSNHTIVSDPFVMGGLSAEGLSISYQSGTPAFSISKNVVASPDYASYPNYGCYVSLPLASPLPLNTWVHVAVTSSSTAGLTLYIDGVVVATNTSACALGDTSYTAAGGILGTILVSATRNASTGLTQGNYLDGFVDENTMYNRVLSAAEIQSVYNAGSFGKCNTTVGGESVSVGGAATTATTTPVTYGGVDGVDVNVQTGSNGFTVFLPDGSAPLPGNSSITVVVDDGTGGSTNNPSIVINASLPAGTTKNVTIPYYNKDLCVNDAPGATVVFGNCSGVVFSKFAVNQNVNKQPYLPDLGACIQWDGIHNMCRTASGFTIEGMSNSAIHYPTDDDNDGVIDGEDKCPGTDLAGPIPTEGLNPGHMGDDTTIFGCNATQILACKPGNNSGSVKNGVSAGLQAIFALQMGWASGCY